MNTLAEIETAAEALPPEQKEELFRFLAARSRGAILEPGTARLVRQGNDSLLTAAPGALPMTPENVKRMLEDWP